MTGSAGDPQADEGGGAAPPPDRVGLGRRTAVALAWNFGASPLQLGVAFVRSVLLLRLLPVAVFGTFAFATSIVFVSSLLAGFGMGHAFLNRVPETRDERRAADVYFTVKTLATLVWAAVVIALALLFASGDLRTMLVVLTLTQSGTLFVDTPRLILTRRVVHRRLVGVDTLAVLAGSATAVALAAAGETVWALLGSEVAVLVVTAGMLVAWRPVWRPRFRWEPDIVRYYLRFARASLPTSLLMRGIENLDNLWTGAVLGDYALGIYSRAYRFATYPRTLIALPTSKVVRGTFSELKEEPAALTRAFAAVNGTLVRTGGLLAGLLVIGAPELVLLVGGEKWLDMVVPFQLLVVFALLDPVRLTLTDLLLGIGEQASVLRSYAAQILILAAGIVVLGGALGVPGVALAVNVMTVFATVTLFRQASRFVRLSHRQLWLGPAAALALGTAATFLLLRLVPDGAAPWAVLALKGAAYGGTYAAVLGTLERHHVRMAAGRIRGLLGR